jgi:hypothetical protein
MYNTLKSSKVTEIQRQIWLRQLRIPESGKKRKLTLLDTLFSKPDLKQHLFPCVSVVHTLTQDPSISDVSMYSRDVAHSQCLTSTNCIEQAQALIINKLADAVVVGRKVCVLKRTESAESSEDEDAESSGPVALEREDVDEEMTEELAEPSPIESLVSLKRGHRSQSMSTMDYSVSSDSSDADEDAAVPSLSVGIPAIETILAAGLNTAVLSPSLPGLTNSETVLAKRALTKAQNTPPENKSVAALTRGVLNGVHTLATFNKHVLAIGHEALWAQGAVTSVQATKACEGKLGTLQLQEGDTCLISTESFALGYVIAKVHGRDGQLHAADVVEADALDPVTSSLFTRADGESHSPCDCSVVTMTRKVLPGCYCGSICLFPNRGVLLPMATLPLFIAVPSPQCSLIVAAKS